MTHDLASLKAALRTAPALAMKARLTRRGEYLALARYGPPNWLSHPTTRGSFVITPVVRDGRILKILAESNADARLVIGIMAGRSGDVAVAKEGACCENPMLRCNQGAYLFA